MFNRLLGVGTHLYYLSHLPLNLPQVLLYLPPGLQNGVTLSIKPQQVTYIVPGSENFEDSDIGDFIQKARDNLVGLA